MALFVKTPGFTRSAVRAVVAVSFVGERLAVAVAGKTRAAGRNGSLDLAAARKTRLVSLGYLVETTASTAIRVCCR